MLKNSFAKHVKPLEVSDPGKILELCSSLTDKHSTELQIKINNYLVQECGAVGVFLVPMLEASEEGIIQAIGEDPLANPMRLSVTDVLMGSASSKEPYSIPFSELDSQFKELIPKEAVGSRVVMVPVLNQEGELALLVGLLGLPHSEPAESKATRIVTELFRYCLTLISNTVRGEEQARLKVQCQRLLRVARRLFSQLADLEVLLKGIMAEARRLTAAERCSLFLLDNEQGDLVAKVFDNGDDSTTPAANEVPEEVRIKRGQGIAGHVAETGRLLNIRHAYEHPLFYKGLDEKTGFVTRNILCFPIRDEDGIIGVAQLCNKVGGKHFDACDEEVAQAFSIYCGISIIHSIVYKKVSDAQARTVISNEMLMYHLKVNSKDVNKVVTCRHQHNHPQLPLIHFNSRSLNVRETPCYILKMFDTLNLCKKFQIRRDTLTRFTLYVQKGYRDMPYHNWMHAFSVSHFAFAAISQLKLLQNGYLTELECLTYMVSCMCHDLDHRGTNNSFEVTGGSLLASLYSSEGSVMERHHLSQAMCILNTEGCNILQGLPPGQYDRCLQLLRDCILATDLSNHFKQMSAYKAMVQKGFSKDDPADKQNLLCMLMTCADLADQIKDWTCVKKVAAAVYTEFFHQGDEEKQRGRSPQEMMDREKAFIPDLQIQFLENITIPVFDVLASLFPQASTAVTVMKEHVSRWQAARGVFDRAGVHGGYQLLHSHDLDTAIDEVLHCGNAN